MKITITPMMLCDLLGGKFTLEACEAICDWFDGLPDAPAIGDIAVSFSEYPSDCLDEDNEERVIATLNNSNVLVAL